MGELAEHSADALGRALGNTFGQTVTTVMTAVYPELAPFAVPVGALAGSFAEQTAIFARRVWADRAERVGRFIDTAAAEADTPFENLLDQAMRDPAMRELLVRAARAAASSLDEEKVDLLARIYVHGAADDARVDEALVLVDAVQQLEVPHLRVLRLLAQPGPRELPSDNGVIRAWSNDHLRQADEGLAGALDALISKLVALGLAYDEGIGRRDYQPYWRLTSFGENCANYLAARGSA